MFLLGFICGIIVGVATIIVMSCAVNSGNIDRQIERQLQ